MTIQCPNYDYKRLKKGIHNESQYEKNGEIRSNYEIVPKIFSKNLHSFGMACGNNFSLFNIAVCYTLVEFQHGETSKLYLY